MGRMNRVLVFGVLLLVTVAIGMVATPLFGSCGVASDGNPCDDGRCPRYHPTGRISR